MTNKIVAVEKGKRKLPTHVWVEILHLTEWKLNKIKIKMFVCYLGS